MADVSPTKPNSPPNPYLSLTKEQRRTARLALYRCGGSVKKLTLTRTAAGAKVSAISLGGLKSRCTDLSLSAKSMTAKGVSLEATAAGSGVVRLRLESSPRVKSITSTLELDLNGPNP